jgi:hypothetical protein
MESRTITVDPNAKAHKLVAVAAKTFSRGQPEHWWMTPAGDLAQSNPVLKQLGLHSLGRPARVHLLLTETLLIVGQEGGTHREGGGPEKVPDFEISDPKLCAYDKATGEQVGEVALPRNATVAPMTYMLSWFRPGVQSICGTHCVVLALA